MPKVTAFGSSFASQGVEKLGFDSSHRRDTILFPEQIIDPQSQLTDLGLFQEKIESVNLREDSTINGSKASDVQRRAEAIFVDDLVYIGTPYDSDTALTSPPMTVGGVGGSITRNVTNSQVQTGNVSNWRYLYSGILAQTIDDGTVQWQDRDIEFYCTAEFSDTTNQDAFIGMFARTLIPPGLNSTDTDRHIGFYFQDDEVYASNADGTTQTKSADLTGKIRNSEGDPKLITDMNVYWFKSFATERIEFYINNDLVYESFTNLPLTQDGIAFIGIADTGSSRTMDIKNNYSWILKKT